MLKRILGIFLSGVFFSGSCGFLSSAWAGSTHPVCLGQVNQVLPIDDTEVIQMKQSTPNQYLARAHVEGVVRQIYPEKNGHTHFEIALGPNPGDTLEVIYNSSFGSLPELDVGLKVEACGDYITSYASTHMYPASPDGAIIHWVHGNPSGHGHPSGFLVIEGVLYGQN